MPIRSTARRFLSGLTAAAVLGGAALAPLAAQTPAPAAAAAAPAGITPEQVKAFIGEWTIAADGPNGPISMALVVKNTEGKITGEISSEQMPKQAITDIAKAGENLVMRDDLDYQGNAVPVVVTLTPAGEKVNVAMDFAGGAFVLSGVATKKK
jgi:hypothetical protein